MNEIEPEVPGDFASRGTRMLEADSFDRVVEGLKIAADGARHLAPWRPEQEWDNVASLLDSLRIAFARLGRRNVPSDVVPSERVFGPPRMMRMQAYDRVYDGLKQAAGGARQMATGHRNDFKYSQFAAGFDMLRDKCSALVRSGKRRPLILM